jgi:putative hemolysin
MVCITVSRHGACSYICMRVLVMEFLIIILLIVLNGLFAMSEMSIVSARKTRLQQWADEGNTKARIALDLANAPNNLLSTVQIGITLIGILAGAFGGASVATTIADQVRRLPFLAPYSDTIGFGLVVVVTAYLSLVIGELAPKRLALNSPERIAATVAAPMRLLSTIAAPIVRLLSLSTDIVLRLLGTRPSTEPPITEEEIKVLIAQGAQAGVFAESEQEMVERVFRLGDLRVNAVMTPRTEMVWLDLDDPTEQNLRKIADSHYAAYPVGQGTPDTIRGVLYAKDLLARLLNGQPIDLEACLCPAVFVPDGMAAVQVLDLLKEAHAHIALVIDEHGGVEGLVTVNSIAEEIVGDIPHPKEIAEPFIVRREDGTWLLDGRLSVDEFKEHFALGRLPGEDLGRFRTIGGFVVQQIGRIPAVSDYFEWAGLRFEVIDMDGPRVDKVLVGPAMLSEDSSNRDSSTVGR